MSVKFPQISKREAEEPSPVSQKKSNFEANPSQSYNYEGQFDQVGPEDPVEPAETFTALKKREQPTAEMAQSRHLEVSVKKEEEQEAKEPQSPQMNVSQLNQQLEEKTNKVNLLKSRLLDKKKEIKSIGEQVDRDLNKSLLKATSKQAVVNIRDIFSAPPKTTNPQLNSLNEELKKVRLSTRKVKVEIEKLTSGMSDPVSVLNQERGVDIANRMREADNQIRALELQKKTMSVEIERGSQGVLSQEEKQMSEDIAKMQAMQVELLNANKEEKSKIYQIEREDILLMEKGKFFQEREKQMGNNQRKKPTSSIDKQKIEKEIKQLLQSINSTISERNRTEQEKKQKKKMLNADISSLQAKNWEICNKLREIDSVLLSYYEKKSRKKDSVKPVPVPEETRPARIKNSKSGAINMASSQVESSPAGAKRINDKNVEMKHAEVEPMMIEKKKVYEFVGKEASQQEICLSDQFLGSKLKVRKISIIADDKYIYNFACQYGIFGSTVQGYVMGSKKIPPKAIESSLQLNLDQDESINLMQIAIQADNRISFMHIVTTQAQELRWGIQQGSQKGEQKHIKKYEWGFFKGKMMALTQQKNEDADLFYYLSSLTFSTVYMGVSK